MPEHSSPSTALPEYLGRTVDMLGEAAVRRLRRSTVVIAGLGGVGSHAAMALARSGVGRLRLVDHDVVTPTSLNRHAVAVSRDLGLPKAEVVARQIEGLDPTIDVEVIPLFIDGETVGGLLEGPPQLVVDAIDSLNPKVTLLQECALRGVPVVSSMGASSRSDPTLVRRASLAETTICPLARAVRKRLRRRGVAPEAILAVFSLEEPRAPLPPDEDEPRLERGRTRNRLPSLGTLPGIFGYALAGAGIELLIR